jgi:hypothetical protein
VAETLAVETSQRFTGPQWDWLTAQAYARSGPGSRVSVAQVVRELVEEARTRDEDRS